MHGARSTCLGALRLGAAGADVGEHTGLGDRGLGGDVRVRRAGLRKRADREADEGGEDGETHGALWSKRGG